MEGIGAEVSQKIRSAIKAKFKEIGLHVDDELPDYVMVMVANKRSKEQMDEDLQLFLGKHTSLFTTWLHQVLQKLQEVTVAKLDVHNQSSSPLKSEMNLERIIALELYENRLNIGVKRKLDEPKKKKKSKQDLEQKEIKKKIKEEPEDKDSSLKEKDGKKECKDNSNSDNDKESQSQESESNKKRKIVSKTSLDQSNDITVVPKSKRQKEDTCDSSLEEQQKKSEGPNEGRRKSLSVSSQVEDLDDEDCINIRTDGELLDTLAVEDLNVEESSKRTKEKEDSNSRNKIDRKDDKQTNHSSPVRNKDKSKTTDPNVPDKVVTKEKPISPKKRSPTPSKTPPKTAKTDDKVIDARELLNRKKAAKKADSKTRSRSRSRERDRSLSPVRKRREDERESRGFREERVSHRRLRDEDRETSRKHSREEDRDRRGPRDREHPVKRRDDWPRKLESDKIEQRNKERRRESSVEPPPKRVMLDRTFRNKSDDWGTGRTAKASEGRKTGAESPKRKDAEEGPRRPGLVSRVVARTKEPEEESEAPSGVPSVVKVTPRPRRPPSQQPSTSLIMRAISEANKSLANVPQRPDSTQRGRKEPVFSRPLRQLKRIPPEKIAVEIQNPLALKNAEPSEEIEDDIRSVSPIPKDKSGRNMSPPSDHFNMEVTPSEPEVTTQNITEAGGNEPNEERPEESPQQEVEVEDEIELEPSQDLETLDEPVEEASEPQFVVTLNGYDPDGIFSQSELEDDEEPLLTSTPEEVDSPRPKREINSSPNVIMGAPAVNHNNLIEVEIMRTKTERCKYWPACRLGDKCTYYHPSKPCKVFPNCKFGDSCLYIHPQCKFNALCTRKDCVFAHTSAHTPVQPPVVVPKAKALYAASAPPCKFFPNCTNIHCQFSHPLRACRFGLYCTKKDCTFEHGQVAPVDKLKWTRVPPS